jgi:ABC-type antimicrobial peptide transport system permease subunit
LAQPVAVVNQTLAQRFWPGQDAVGRRFIPGPPGSAPNFVTIVGVVGDVKQFGLDSEATMDIYFPDVGARYLVVRTAGDAGILAGAVERALGTLEPGLAVTDVRTMSAIVGESSQSRRWTAGLLASFAALALALALVGIYGVVSWAVAQRTREIGIRMALGANRALVARQVMGQGLLLVGIGGAVGIALAALGAQALTAVLNGVTPLDPASYAGAIGVLAVAAGAACYVPARRAASVDPLRALRQL